MRRRRAIAAVGLAALVGAGCSGTAAGLLKITSRDIVEDPAVVAQVSADEDGLVVERLADGQTLRLLVRRPCVTDVGAGLRIVEVEETGGLRLLVDPTVADDCEPAVFVEETVVEFKEGTSAEGVEVVLE